MCHTVPLLEEGSGELQASQPDLGVREGCGTDPPECGLAACTGQQGDQPAQLPERQILPDQARSYPFTR